MGLIHVCPALLDHCVKQLAGLLCAYGLNADCGNGGEKLGYFLGIGDFGFVVFIGIDEGEHETPPM